MSEPKVAASDWSAWTDLLSQADMDKIAKRTGFVDESGQFVMRNSDKFETACDIARSIKLDQQTPAHPETRNPIYGEGLGLHSKHDDAKELKRLGIAYGDAPTTPQPWPNSHADKLLKLRGTINTLIDERDAARAHADKLAEDVEAERKAKMTWANAARDSRAHADKLAALSIKIGNESVAVVNERDALRAHTTALAKACRLWHKASLQPEGSKAQADLGNAAALASRAALAAYDASKGGKQ